MSCLSSCAVCLYSSFTHVLVFWFDVMSGMSFHVSGDRSFWSQPAHTRPSAIVMCNHVSYFDWPVMFMCAVRAGMGGSLRVVLKEVGKYMPGMSGRVLERTACLCVDGTCGGLVGWLGVRARRLGLGVLVP
jgi:1-acyl-sn-glycerol-3-phosphate acyltransferase